MLIRFDGSKNKLYEFIYNYDKAISLIKPELKTILFAIIETKLTDKARLTIRRNRSLKNAPTIFQRLKNTVLSGIENYSCFVHLNNIVIDADTLENHSKCLNRSIKRLSKFNLKIKPDECEFLCREVIYLIHVITDESVKPDKNKVTTYLNFPALRNVKKDKSF